MSERRICVITGASKGIGLATARKLAQLGYYPIGLARKAPEDFPGGFIELDLAISIATFAVAIDIAKG
jgi:3-oxoacyl-[acyl-carrier protein] reductase